MKVPAHPGHGWEITARDAAARSALENPVGCISSRIRNPESKTTCLWLKNLPMKKTPTPTPTQKRGRGQPRGEPTKLIRAYTADVPSLCRKGETQAEAVRRLVEMAGRTTPAIGHQTDPRPSTKAR